ncbi:FixH family protein [Alteromonas facilis]|uniref:FixH family protein n=1 Tax=Alteromonas facilis TaxID=2048004 RepID=UPI000C294842|nr:FixH family protein [Alteromonas facilis]
MTKTNITPWYKQFWPWFLIAVPMSSFIVGFIMFHLASNTTDSLVVDDYYKEGRAINARLDKIQTARTLNIKTELTFAADGSIALKFLSGTPRSSEALKLSLYHVTLKDRDVDILLSTDAQGVYRGFTEEVLDGKWRVTLLPLDESWKIQQVIALPQTSSIRFEP